MTHITVELQPLTYKLNASQGELYSIIRYPKQSLTAGMPLVTTVSLSLKGDRKTHYCHLFHNT